MGRWKVICADVLEAQLEGEFDACLCDPPYGLSFMGCQWDRSGVSFQVETWERALGWLKPGAHLMAFGGTRTSHRLTCAVEDAGFEIRDCLMYLYGQGFPKSLDVSKAIDKAAGHWRGKAGVVTISSQPSKGTEYERTPKGSPITPEAARWSGWGTALKPSWEPILLAMKPLDGTFAQNALKHGVAGLWVDGGRIKTDAKDLGDPLRFASVKSGKGTWDAKDGGMFDEGRRGGWMGGVPAGRWPSNLLLAHTPWCQEVGTKRMRGPDGSRTEAWAGHADADGLETAPAFECHPSCPVRMLDEQAGSAVHGAGHARKGSKNPRPAERRGAVQIAPITSTGAMHRLGDAGGPSRFFYCAKVDSSERGDSKHPTMKPIDLCAYLARLLLPPERKTPRRLLVPFSGSGSEMIGALRAGWDEVIGIEQDAEYCELARQRIRDDAPLLNQEME